MNYIYLAIIILLAGLYLYERFFGGESRREKNIKIGIKIAQKEIKTADRKLKEFKKEREKLSEELTSALAGLSVDESMRTSSKRAKR